MEIEVFKNDLPHAFENCEAVAVDTETMGLLPYRDRLCLSQFSAGDDKCYLVQLGDYSKAVNIKKLLGNSDVLKIFHYARFDMMMFYRYLKIMPKNIYCTKIASKLVRTYAASHSLLELCKDMLSIEISKEQTCSDWGADELLEQQKEYAATDVLYLHRLKKKLDMMLVREGRSELSKRCFEFLQTRVELDLLTDESYDIFAH
ncbi:MAG: ribonuclease D [Holosporales bacterium]|jgi:ribonuclease D|nr:ribonuclease D [Holosporales bacterium]